MMAIANNNNPVFFHIAIISWQPMESIPFVGYLYLAQDWYHLIKTL
jgi:hypothetical protein